MPATSCFSNDCEATFLTAQCITTQLYVALVSTLPDQTTSGTELSGNGYARTAINFGSPSLNSFGNQMITQNADCSFPTSTGSQGTAVGYVLWDDPTAGNFIAMDVFDTPVPILASGITFKILSGTITVSMR